MEVPSRPGLRLSWALALSLAAAGCSGDIVDPSRRPGGAATGPSVGAQPVSPGGPTGSASSGSGGAGGSGTGPRDLPANPSDPGRVSIRRLNRAEYNLTVRDLLGTMSRPADGFEADLAGFGYDNNGDVQTLTTVQIEQYQAAAEALVAEATAGGTDRIAQAARAAPCEVTAAACQRSLVAGFARRAWRRPVASEELTRLLKLADGARARGETALGQLQLALVGVLSSPHFYFRAEIDPDPRSPTPRPLNGYELASRLSYLIYRSMPDDPLFAAAEGGRLARADDVRREAVRMLADPKGAELIRGFVGQWLDVNSLSQHEVDAEKLGPGFSRELAASMQAETSRFVGEFLHQNLPIAELLSARFSFVDARLAQHYGMRAGPAGEPSRVELADGHRRGLLTQAAILTATSNPDRTSPVARGAWVLTHLLCAPPPPPPPDVPALPEQQATPTTAREQLAAHAADPGCAACHVMMDAIGLGLENYDAVGRWRDTEAGQRIDASGTLPDGARFNGALELADLLTRDPRVPTCVAGNLYTYAISRLPEPGSVDGQHVDRIVALAGGPQARLQDVVLHIVTSDPFRLRRGEPAAGVQP